MSGKNSLDEGDQGLPRALRSDSAALQRIADAPKGWEGTVLEMKKEDDIDNPWALANWMKNEGYKSHKKPPKKKSKKTEAGTDGIEVTAMSRDWGAAVAQAKSLWWARRRENKVVDFTIVENHLLSQGFMPATAASAANSVANFFSSIERRDGIKGTPAGKALATASHPSFNVLMADLSEDGDPSAKEILAEIQTLTKKASEEYEFSCTMAYLPKDLAERAVKLALQIGDCCLHDPKDEDHGYGRELEPHITVKFGTHTDNPDDIKDALGSMGPIRAKFGRVSRFEDNEDYDVLKVDVVSDDLAEANKRIGKGCECTDSYPNYQPHLTVAYVKKGEASHMDGSKELDGIEAVFDELTFCDTVGNRHIIPLNGSAGSEKGD